MNVRRREPIRGERIVLAEQQGSIGSHAAASMQQVTEQRYGAPSSATWGQPSFQPRVEMCSEGSPFPAL